MNDERPRFDTREEWLAAAAEVLGERIADIAGSAPEVRVGIGFPSTGIKGRRLSESWPREASPDNLNEITIALTVDDPTEVLSLLLYEMACSVYDGSKGRPASYWVIRILVRLGYEGIEYRKVGAPKPGTVLAENLAALAAALGEYPGDSGLNVKRESRQQTNRMFKGECNECGLVLRMSARWWIKVNQHDDGGHCPDSSCGGTLMSDWKG